MRNETIQSVAEEISRIQNIDIERCKQFIDACEMIELPTSENLAHGGATFSFRSSDEIATGKTGTITCFLKAEATIKIPGYESEKHFNAHYAMTCAHCIVPTNPQSQAFNAFDRETQGFRNSSVYPLPFDRAWTGIPTAQTQASTHIPPPKFKIRNKQTIQNPKEEEPLFNPLCLFRSNYPWLLPTSLCGSFDYQHPPEGEATIIMSYLCSRFGLYPENAELPRRCLNFRCDQLFSQETFVYYTLDVGILKVENNDNEQSALCHTMPFQYNIQLPLTEDFSRSSENNVHDNLQKGASDLGTANKIQKDMKDLTEQFEKLTEKQEKPSERLNIATISSIADGGNNTCSNSDLSKNSPQCKIVEYSNSSGSSGFLPPENNSNHHDITGHEITIDDMKDIWKKSINEDHVPLKLLLMTNNNETRTRSLNHSDFYFQAKMRPEIIHEGPVNLPVIIFNGENIQEHSIHPNTNETVPEFIQKGVSGSPIFLMRENDEDTLYFLGNVCSENSASRYDVAIKFVAPQIYADLLKNKQRKSKNAQVRCAMIKAQNLIEKHCLKEDSHKLARLDFSCLRIELPAANSGDRSNNSFATVKLRITPCFEGCGTNLL